MTTEEVYLLFERTLSQLRPEMAETAGLLETYLHHPSLESVPDYPAGPLRELLLIEFHWLQTWRPDVNAADYEQRFSDQVQVVRDTLAEHQRRMESRLEAVPVPRPVPVPMPRAMAAAPTERPLPGLISGRYQPLRRLGRGGFGEVLLCHDNELDRRVAIKIPRLWIDASEATQQEGRTLARFSGSNIPQVYDTFVDTINGRRCVCLVMQYIEGQTLSQALSPRATSPNFERIAEILAEVAGILQGVHRQRIWHWDLKPANIMIDAHGKLWIVDFGLAVIERDRIDREGRWEGTLRYMSPEQAAGEISNRDGRSDLWSLGVILYELLTGELPFQGSSEQKILESIQRHEPVRPRTSRPEIPVELERICLKCLQKHPDARHQSAADLQQDLQSWKQPASPGKTAVPAAALATPVEDTPATPPSGVRFRGLRSYTEEDADFFLQLLPGIREKNGLPPAVDFWKQRLDNLSDRVRDIPVGLLIGPSGCGKSSLMKAGVIPLLDRRIKSCVLEPAAEQLEARLRQELVKLHPDLADSDSLAELFRRIRDQHQQERTKLLLVIDQFEQWLHVKDETDWTNLADALRYCDEVHLQTVVIVRSDFYSAISSFFRLLGKSIDEKTNCQPLELWSQAHARQVLQLFGVQLKQLPERIEPKSVEEQFLRRVVQDLSHGGKVTSVHLAVFVQMFEGRDWTLESLDEVGGAKGIGVAFLQQSLAAADAPIANRKHQRAAQAALRAMLPPTGTEVRGYRVTETRLKIAARYQQREEDFQELLKLLDDKLRLITPVDTAAGDEQSEPGHNAASSASVSEKQYELTHDFLVPSLREWLFSKLKESPAGQAQLLLEERAVLWGAQKESRQLPSLLEYLRIWRHVDRDVWTPAQQTMMERAGRLHRVRGALAVAVLCIVMLVGVLLRSQITANRARDLAATIAGRKTSELESGLEQMQPLREHALPELQRLFEDAADGSDGQLHLAIARLHLGDPDEKLLPVVSQLALQCRPEQLLPLSSLLQPWKDSLSAEWQTILRNSEETDGRRLHAACLLAGWEAAIEEGEGTAWSDPKTADFVAAQLVQQNLVFVGQYQEVLRPQASRLKTPLATLFADPQQGEVAKKIITGLLADYAKDDAAVLARVLLDADPAADRELFPLLKPLRADAIGEFHAVLDQKLTPQWPDEPLDPTWQRPTAEVQARIAAAQGILTDRFALCLEIPFSQLLPLVESLRGCGYRPTRLRPHAGVQADDPLMSAVWTRDGRKWSLQTALKPEDLPQPEVNAERDDLLLDDLVLIPGSGPNSGWLTLWSEATTGDEQRRCAWGLSQAALETLQGQMTEQKFASQLSLQAYADAAGKRRFAAVFSNTGPSSDTLLSWSGFERIDSPQRDLTSGPVTLPELPDPRQKYRTQLLQMPALSPQELQEPQARFDRATALFQTGQPELALVELDWLNDNLPEPNQLVLHFRTQSLAQLGRNEEATASFAVYQQTNADRSVLDCMKILLAAWNKDVRAAQAAIDGAVVVHQQSGDGLYNIACAAALCARAFRQQDAATEASKFDTQALDLLVKALDAGFQNSTLLQEDVDFADLHKDERFLAIVQRLVPAEPFAGIWCADPLVETRLLRARSTADILAQLTPLLSDAWCPVTVAVQAVAESPQTLVLLQRPLIPEADRDALAIRQGAAAVALLRLDATDRVWPLLQDSPDPSVRSNVLNRLRRYGMDAQTLITRLAAETDVGRRRALIQGLGELAETGLITDAVKPTLISDLLSRYSSDPDSGVHGMCEWTLRKLGAEQQLVSIQQQFAKGAAVGDRRWYLTKTGGKTQEDTAISLAIVDATEEFRMGSPLSERGRDDDERLHRRRINRVYAIGMHEITVAQFLRFRRDHEYNRNYSASEDSPVNGTSWYDAAEFCNWLSEQEGIPQDQWCYDPNQRFASGMRLRPNYLQLTGYRLPTEAEWEHACRGGTSTSRFFGSGESLLGDYAWYTKNSSDARTVPVGTQVPNGHGLFGMYGNVFEWCQDLALRFPLGTAFLLDNKQSEDLEVVDTIGRVLRGGSFDNFAALVRSANRSVNRPDNRLSNLGFRVSRTYPLPP